MDPVVPQPDSTTTLFPKELIEAYPSLTKFNDVAALGKSYGEMEKMAGSKLAIPGADAKPEDWDAFYSKVGRPAKVEEYKLERPKFEGLEFTYPEATEKSFLDAAHKAGLNPKQAQALLNWWGDSQTKELQGAAKIANESQDALKKDWGDNFDANVKQAQAGFKAFVGDEHKDLGDLLKMTGMDSHPAVLRFFKDLNSKLGEGKVVMPDQDDNKADEKQQIRDEIEKVRAEFDKLPVSARETRGKEYGEKLKRLYDKLTA